MFFVSFDVSLFLRKKEDVSATKFIHLPPTRDDCNWTLFTLVSRTLFPVLPSNESLSPFHWCLPLHSLSLNTRTWNIFVARRCACFPLQVPLDVWVTACLSFYLLSLWTFFAFFECYVRIKKDPTNTDWEAVTNLLSTNRNEGIGSKKTWYQSLKLCFPLLYTDYSYFLCPAQSRELTSVSFIYKNTSTVWGTRLEKDWPLDVNFSHLKQLQEKKLTEARNLLRTFLVSPKMNEWCEGWFPSFSCPRFTFTVADTGVLLFTLF